MRQLAILKHSRFYFTTTTCALDIYFGHASSFGTVAAPNISLSVVKLSAILQEYVSSTHSSTVLTGLDSTLPANANSRTFPPLVIVPRLNTALGDTRLPPLETERETRSN